MSVRLMSLAMLDSAVRTLFPIACQKKRTLRSALAANREPYTASALPSRMGPIIFGYSVGSYSRSASWTIPMSPVMFSMAVRIALPLPMLTGWAITLIRESAAASS